MSKSPVILFFDIETSMVETYRFQFDRNPFISPESIIKDWYIISASWKQLGSKTVHAVAMKKVGDDYNVVKELRTALEKADVIVGHCIDRFDLRNLNTRLLYHGLPPLPVIPTIDTKKEAKKIGGFTSNKLDYLAKYLLGEGKIKTDFDLWKSVMAGSKTALKKMVAYNKRDVVVNELVYEKLKPFMRTHPHVGVIAGESKFHSCPNCGSTHLKRNGTRPTRAGILKQEVQCKDCGAYQRIPIEK